MTGRKQGSGDPTISRDRIPPYQVVIPSPGFKGEESAGEAVGSGDPTISRETVDHFRVHRTRCGKVSDLATGLTTGLVAWSGQETPEEQIIRDL